MIIKMQCMKSFVRENACCLFFLLIFCTWNYFLTDFFDLRRLWKRQNQQENQQQQPTTNGQNYLTRIPLSQFFITAAANGQYRMHHPFFQQFGKPQWSGKCLIFCLTNFINFFFDVP
jgi:hypothetical protein